MLELITGRTGLYTLKQVIATSILVELTNQLALLKEIPTKTAYQTYYQNVLEQYFDEDDELILFIDKITIPDEADIPFINIIIEGDETNGNGSVQNTQTEITFNVMVCDKLHDDNGKESDQNVAEKVEFMTGIIKKILENTKFTGIQHKRAKSRSFNSDNNGNSSNITTSSVLFELKYIENVLVAQTLLPLKTNLTNFRGRFQLKTDNLEV